MIAIVTPWKDHLDLAPDYFQAVETGKPDQLIIVDDGSQEPLDFAAVRIERGEGMPGGFCTASNVGLDLVETDQVLFLNNDIKMIQPNWLDKLREKIEPGVIVGPLIFNNSLGPVEYPYIDGWCAAMTTEDARRIGGWDETYDEAGLSYFSDNALSLTARLEGMILRDFAPGLSHKAGQTGGADLALFDRSLKVNGKLFERQVAERVG
jgi:GT2 family glycosyltransferase